MPSRNASQNTPALSASETAVVRMYAPTPVNTVPTPPAKPTSVNETSWPIPTARIMPTLRSIEPGKPGRRVSGTSQTVLSAFWMALATPRPPRNAKISPAASAKPVELLVRTLFTSRLPKPGTLRAASCSTVSRSAGWLRSTTSSTVISTSSSGKIDTNA